MFYFISIETMAFIRTREMLNVVVRNYADLQRTSVTCSSAGRRDAQYFSGGFYNVVLTIVVELELLLRFSIFQRTQRLAKYLLCCKLR